MSEMTSGQQSSESSTQRGINALEQAHSAISRSKQDVDDTKHSLSSTYTGGDGHGYQDLLTAWDEQCQIILNNLQDMIDKLQRSGTQHRQTQSAATDAIHHARSAGQAAFDALAG
ncbi:hypothetical protein [Streptomyces sp. NPDC001843]|uniref:hypothetical protein n=1 Tax=Streptomyces sp. NPDC001843 TaxID=3364617 RepID=UPI0036BE9EDD